MLLGSAPFLRTVLAACTLAFALAGCRGGRHGAPSQAKIVVDGRRTGGASPALELDGARVNLPVEDFGVGADAPAVVEDGWGSRFAYPTSRGSVRVLYRLARGGSVSDAVFVGPLVSAPVDFVGVPDVDHALGPLFEAAGARRTKLVDAVRGAMGEGGVVRLLLESAYVDDPVWDGAARALSADAAKQLSGGMIAGLEAGRPPLVLRRAVRLVDLDLRWLAPLIDRRVRDRAAEVAAPDAVAVLLRTVLRNDPKQAAKMGCEILDAPVDSAHAATLAEAAALAVAATDYDCDEERIARVLVREACEPWVRCHDQACTKDELAEAVKLVAASAPEDALTATKPRPGLFALAWLTGRDRIPPAFERARQGCRAPL